MPAEYIPLTVAVAFFLSVVLVLIGIVQYVRARARKQAMLQKIRSSPQASVPGMHVQEPHKGVFRGMRGRVLGLLSMLGHSVFREKSTDTSVLRPRFLKAGIRSEKAPAIFWGAKIMLAVMLPSGLVVLGAVLPQVDLPAAMVFLLIVVLATAGFYLPSLWLTHKIQQRRQILLDGFPDALDLLVVCVEAGMGLDSAFNRVARESASSNKTLSDELQMFNLEIRAGMSRRDALKNLAMRTDLQEMHNLATLLIQADRFGTSVSQALRVFSDSMRSQRFQRAEEKAAKVPVKILFPLILFVFPALFVAILGPAVIQIYQTLVQM